jgi:hypothetical protein
VPTPTASTSTGVGTPSRPYQRVVGMKPCNTHLGVLAVREGGIKGLREAKPDICKPGEPLGKARKEASDPAELKRSWSHLFVLSTWPILCTPPTHFGPFLLASLRYGLKYGSGRVENILDNGRYQLRKDKAHQRPLRLQRVSLPQRFCVGGPNRSPWGGRGGGSRLPISDAQARSVGAGFGRRGPTAVGE